MQSLNLFKEEYSLPNQLPPENSSAITLDEVRYLQSIKVDKKFVEKNDKIKKVFKETLLELELPYIEEEIDTLLKESGKFVMELKYKYNRPRPWQIAEFYGISLNGVDMKSMKTPSYPSGHATQGYLIGMHFAKRHPEHSKVFKQLGEDIAHSRIIAKAHYPSDKSFGKRVAEYLFTLLK
jgi:acid phosphatase (class A)